LFTHENFIDDFHDEGEQTIIQHRDCLKIWLRRLEPKQNDEVSTYAPPSDEVIQKPISPAQQKDDEVSFFPFQDFDDTLFHDSESEGEMESPNEEHLPCCTIKDEGATHEDKTVMHAKNTKSSKLLHKKKK
jgi:hypothetical protein